MSVSLHVDPSAVGGGGGAADEAAPFERVEPAGDGGGREVEVGGEFGGGRLPAASGQFVEGVELLAVQVEVDQGLFAHPAQMDGELLHAGHRALDVGVQAGQDGLPALHVSVGPVASFHGEIVRRSANFPSEPNISLTNSSVPK